MGYLFNSLQVLGVQHGTELDMPYQTQFEYRAVAALNDGRQVIADFNKRESTEQSFFLHVTTGQIKEIKLQRRRYDWVTFRDVPTRWSDAPIHATSAWPSTCNVAVTRRSVAWRDCQAE